MRIHMLYFGVLKDLIGLEREILELAPDTQVSDAIRFLRVRASNPNDGVWRSLAVAVNREYAPFSTRLSEADEVALLPPVSGGSNHSYWRIV